jgi:hypothetical protein
VVTTVIDASLYKISSADNHCHGGSTDLKAKRVFEIALPAAHVVLVGSLTFFLATPVGTSSLFPPLGRYEVSVS